MRPHWILAGSLILSTIPPSVLYAAEPGPSQAGRSASIERVLADGGSEEPAELWAALLRSDFEVSSLEGRPKGSFEFYAFVGIEDGRKEATQQLAIVADIRRNRNTVLFPFSDFLPGRLIVDDRWLVVNEAGTWELRRCEGWAIAFDQSHLQDYRDPTGLPKRTHGIVKFDLPGYLRGVLASESPSVTWSSNPRSLVAEKASGTTVRVGFRTPNDQRRFGTALSELIIRTSDGSRLAHRGFIVDRESALRVGSPDTSVLAQRIGAVDRTSEPANASDLVTESPAKRKAAIRLEEELGYLALSPGDVLAGAAVTQAQFQDEGGLAGPKGPRNRVVLTRQSGPSDANGFVALLIDRLEEAYLVIQRAITKDGRDPLVDDSNLLWLGFERMISPRLATIVFGATVSDCLAAEQVGESEKIRLCMTFGEFGAPAWAPAKPNLPSHGDLFLDAVLRARWNEMPRQVDLDECFERVRDRQSSATEREAAVDSLIRWGKLHEIDAKQVDDWFTAKLAASDMQRHCAWKALTCSPSGRAFLVERLPSLQDRPERQREIAVVLRHRAIASLETKRIDFMTEAECEAVLRTCKGILEAE